LFSDHAYAFEERDLIALERMGDLTLTALNLTEKKIQTGELSPKDVPSTPLLSPVEAKSPDQISTEPAKVTPLEPLSDAPPGNPLGSGAGPAFVEQVPTPELPAVHVPEAMRRVQKCSACGFPISEGRELCVDCENKRYGQADSVEPVGAGFVPAFLASSRPPDESWLANHVNLLAVLVLVLSIVVAVVVFH